MDHDELTLTDHYFIKVLSKFVKRKSVFFYFFYFYLHFFQLILLDIYLMSIEIFPISCFLFIFHKWFGYLFIFLFSISFVILLNQFNALIVNYVEMDLNNNTTFLNSFILTWIVWMSKLFYIFRIYEIPCWFFSQMYFIYSFLLTVFYFIQNNMQVIIIHFL